ncbi:MAG TPA: TMEM175 family protein [Chthoniobacterales bacterium]
MSNLTGAPKGERFTARLEAFSDLVFGFSLSLLATRLDVPARPEDIFNSTRWIAIIGTFALVCRFWLEHYRIFRHDFVAENFDAVLNFVFLFGIAILPYALLTFLRFQLFLSAFTLYAGDFSLILSSLSILRVRSLRQRRGDPDLGGRVGEWRRSVAQFGVAILLALFLLALHSHGGTFMEAMRAYDVYLVMAFILILLGARRGLRSLPAFLSAKGGAGELPA